ncbi:MAG: hypothetical protein ACKOJH_06090 [Actinomycetota bacterium]|nr:hypothetical protein [Actinomycetota bacterium]
MSDESLVDAARRDAELLRLTTELRALRALNSRFELEVLNSRDFAVGQAAQIGELRHKLIKQAALLELRLHEFEIHSGNYREHIARLESALAESARAAAQVDVLRRELTATRSSTTWKLGRVLMFPVRVVKRLLRRG